VKLASLKPSHRRRGLIKLGFFTALKFLTIFPLPERWGKATEHLAQSLPYFPLVGLLLGAILFGINYVLSYILPQSINSVLLIIALIVMTGAHHLDGLMDSFDGVVSGKSRKKRLEIMADSHVGAFGIIAAILLLLLKYASLSGLSGMLVSVLLLMPMLSRWIMVSAISMFPYAKSSGMGLAFKQGATWQRLAIATAVALVVTVLLMGWKGLAVIAVLWLIAFGIASYFNSRLGGLTGDVYGALNEISEVLVLILSIIVMRL
jgi:adenosylcobinamide-GDP ribazoletransferase